MSQAKSASQYAKAWDNHINELHHNLCWDLIDKQTADESAELEAALKIYRKYITKAALENFPITARINITEEQVRDLMDRS